MKKSLITGTLVVLLAACSSAQKNEENEGNEKKQTVVEVPEAVINAFKQHYPNISDVDWAQEGANYEAEFETNETEISVVMDVNGGILETETEIDATALPKAALDYLESSYKGQKINEAAKIVLTDGTIQYEAEVKQKDLLFDTNGVFLKEETE